MTTYGGDDRTGNVMAIVCGIIVLACLACIPLMQSDTQKRKEATPCSNYREVKLSDLPAKCVTTEGGYKP